MPKNHTSFQALVYDLIEPFRPLVEYAVFKFCQRNQIRYPKKREYAHTKDGTVIMETALITRFLEKLEAIEWEMSFIYDELKLFDEEEHRSLSILHTIKKFFVLIFVILNLYF